MGRTIAIPSAKKCQPEKMHISMRIILPLFSFLLIGSLNAQEKGRILLLDAFLHVGNGHTMERSSITIEDGVIIDVRNSLAFTYDEAEWDTVLNLKGQHVYPGFVAPNSTLGLTEIDAVRATRDFDEVGTFNPHIRSQIAYNVESKVISTVRTNGILMTQAAPRGGRISGSSAIMFMEGWNWEDATVRSDDGIHLNWPSSMQGGGWWDEPQPKDRNKEYDKHKDEIYEFFEMAKNYSSSEQEKDIRLEAMRECFKGEKRVYIHADELQQLLDIIEFASHFDLPFPVIVGGYDSYLICKQLSDAKIPVMLQRVHSLPENEEDDVDLPYKLPYLLQQGDVLFCLQNAGDMEAMNARNIPFLAGTAMAYGLSEEEAIASVSLNSCKIMGIDKNYGSIEKGKSATLFVSAGNALDMRTSKVTVALVNGKFMSLENSQTELYEKYKEKYAND